MESQANSQNKWWSDWKYIILIFIFFWPVGLYLIYLKVAPEKKTAIRSGRAAAIIGCLSLLFAISGFMAINSGDYEPSDVGLTIFFAVTGITVLIIGNQMRIRSARYRKYISLIVNNGIVKIDEISSATSFTEEVVKKDLQNLINIGFFKGAFLDERKRQIQFTEINENSFVKPANNSVTMEPENGISLKIVTCHGCGAKNKIIAGTVGKCEYCNTVLK